MAQDSEKTAENHCLEVCVFVWEGVCGGCVCGEVGGSSRVLDRLNDCEWLNSAVSQVVFTGK